MNYQHGCFDGEQLSALQKAFDAVCKDKGVSESDAEGRERIAKNTPPRPRTDDDWASALAA